MHPQSAPLTALQLLGRLMSGIVLTLSGRVTFTALPPLLVGEVLSRFNRIKHRIAHIAAMVRDGKYRPPVKRTTPPRPAAPGARKPPKLDPRMRKFGWLGEIYPDMPPLRGSLNRILQEPDMVKLIEAPPKAMLPPLRSLVWAFGYPAPPILARPRRPRKPRAEQPAAEKPQQEPPLEWDWNGRLSPEARANVPHADPLIYRMRLKGVRRPKGTRRGPPKTA
jgi:hypothetical protein